MGLQEEVALLKNIPLFANIDPAKLKLLAFTSQRIRFSAGDVLFRQGESGDAAYVIIAGGADVSIDTEAGQLVVAKMAEHDLVGEIAILCDVPRTATVTATSDLEALCITKELFFQLAKEFPEIGIAIMRELAHRLEHTNARLREMAAAKGA